MKIKVSKASIKLAKELNDLDELVTDFVKLLDRNKVKYVLVSGYVSIRFAKKDQPIPNIVFMFPKAEDLDNWVLKNGRHVRLNRQVLKISPIELQISYKLFLASGKDIEDATHLYQLFNEYLNKKLLTKFLLKLDKKSLFNRYLA